MEGREERRAGSRDYVLYIAHSTVTTNSFLELVVGIGVEEDPSSKELW